MIPAEIYLSLGSNQGDRKKNIEKAVAGLDSMFGTENRKMASIIETEPWGFVSENRFCNTAVCYVVDKKDGVSYAEWGQEILAGCKRIEMEMGRKAEGPEYDDEGRRIYHSRIIDIDILFIGSSVISVAGLEVPHPLMKKRDFVMIPLMEIASRRLMESFPEIFDGK